MGAGHAVSAQALGKLRQVDAIVHVVRAFEDDEVPHVLESIDPDRDLDTTSAELLFADHAVCETVVEKMRAVAKKPTATQKADQAKLEVLERLLAVLDEGRPVRDFRPEGADERKAVDQYEFLTAKDHVTVFNVDEDDLGHGDLSKRLTADHPGSIALCAKMEMELARLPEDERAVFLSDLEITEPAAALLAHQAYAALGAISFFTVGPSECRAWTIRRGDDAVTAAGKIHTDFAKNFIRGEVFSVEDILEYGDEKALKAAGKMRLEGKEYILREGEIFHVLANTR
jgi:GTP-binding protein YchF